MSILCTAHIKGALSSKTCALTWENVFSDMCTQRRLKPAARSLIIVFVVRMIKRSILGYPKSKQRRFWSDRANAQADPNHHCTHMSDVLWSCDSFIEHWQMKSIFKYTYFNYIDTHNLFRDKLLVDSISEQRDDHGTAAWYQANDKLL